MIRSEIPPPPRRRRRRRRRRRQPGFNGLALPLFSSTAETPVNSEERSRHRAVTYT